jgi:signal transduction histidine kinase
LGVTAPQDHDHVLLAAGGAPAAVIRGKEQILERFCDRVLHQLPAAVREQRPVIIDTLPGFLTRVALALSPESGLQFASDYSNIALQHGNERAKLTGYSLAEVVREYQILRELLVETLRDDASLKPADWAVIHRSVDEATAEAAAAFVDVQQRFRAMFTAALSHDFRGPLQNAINYLELIRRDAEPEQRAHFAQRAVANLRRVDQMIAALLDVSRSNAGMTLSLQVKSCEIGTLVKEVIVDLKRHEGERFVLDAPLPVHGFWDCERMTQAIENLISNAVKYGRPGTPITTRIAQNEGRLTLSVHNVGDPIPQSEIPQLFQPFRRSSSAERSDLRGWGLGLALVQAVAQAHGGSVGVDSHPSDGTTFTLDVLLDVRDWKPPG